MRPLLLAYPGNEPLADNLRRALPADTLAFEMRRFPDGETYVRIDGDVRDRVVILLCTLHEPDAKLVPLVFMADTLRQLGVRSLGLVSPYLAYMRQDRRFHTGEALTSASFAHLISESFDWLVTVDPHLHRRRSLAEIYPIGTAVVHAAPLLAEWIRAHISTPVIVGPDAESEQWVSAVAAAIPCPYFVLEKVRTGDREVAVTKVPDSAPLSGHTPVLIDDIISSGRTMTETLRHGFAWTASAPICVGVHGVFGEGAYQALFDAGAARVVTTNSIPHRSNEIDLTPILIEPVRRFVAQTFK